MISQNSDVGLRINALKNKLKQNPSLDIFMKDQLGNMPDSVARSLQPLLTSPKILAAGRLALPAAIAAAIPGDDDATAAVAASLALASPTLIDEAIASKNALLVMHS